MDTPNATAVPTQPAPIRPALDALNRPLRDLRISVTDRCNFRCDYCMPENVFHSGYNFLERAELLSFDEIVRLGRISVGLGVRKIRITGGEPLLRRDLPLLISRLRAIDGLEDLAMTTNGSLLSSRAQELASAGLDRVTVSLDSLQEDVFSTETGTKEGTLARVLDGIAAAHQAGLGPVKVNCVVRRYHNGSPEPLAKLARHFRETPTILRFIEYMDVGTVNDWTPDAVVPAAEILSAIGADAQLKALPAQHKGDVAQRFGYNHYPGEIGVISSVSKPFCGECNRARLSADGHLVTCLFAAGGLDLKAALRTGKSDMELSALIEATWSGRNDRYSELRAEHQRNSAPRRRLEMYQMGG